MAAKKRSSGKLRPGLSRIAKPVELLVAHAVLAPGVDVTGRRMTLGVNYRPWSAASWRQ
jgi:hypothetical protein